MKNMTSSPRVLTAADLYGVNDELAFRRQFVTQFLASYCASNFNDFCARAQGELLERPPVEDAEYLSQTAWKHWCFTMHITRPDETVSATK